MYSSTLVSMLGSLFCPWVEWTKAVKSQTSLPTWRWLSTTSLHVRPCEIASSWAERVRHGEVSRWVHTNLNFPVNHILQVSCHAVISMHPRVWGNKVLHSHVPDPLPSMLNRVWPLDYHLATLYCWFCQTKGGYSHWTGVLDWITGCTQTFVKYLFLEFLEFKDRVHFQISFNNEAQPWLCIIEKCSYCFLCYKSLSLAFVNKNECSSNLFGM